MAKHTPPNITASIGMRISSPCAENTERILIAIGDRIRFSGAAIANPNMEIEPATQNSSIAPMRLPITTRMASLVGKNGSICRIVPHME